MGTQLRPASALRQRALLRRVVSGAASAPDVEESVIDIVAAVLAHAYERPLRPLASRASAMRRRRDLAEAARAELGRAPQVDRSVRDLARTLGTSAFHLCRVFRAVTGMTLQTYRTELRLRLALELLEGSRTSSASLSRIAHRLGFSSHAHFAVATRRLFGVPPSAVRTMLRRPHTE